MTLKRKICIVTVARSDYGLMRGIIREVHNDPDLELQLVVTGMHLSHEYGYTIERIVEDGFPIADKVEISLSSNSRQGMVKSTGLGMISFADSFSRLNPDIVVVLGDRFEMFAAASSANLMNIPVAHIHGGELTYGAVDDSLRHAITKLAHIHFPSADCYKSRIEQMGEYYVYNFGAPGLDYLDEFQFKTRQELETELGIQFRKHNFIVTFHPVTRDDRKNGNDIDILINALQQFTEATIIVTESNVDAGGQVLNKRLREFAMQYPERVYIFKELGLPNYMSLVKQSDVVIGNSSSGVIEVPCLSKPTVNIGSRQDGRLRVVSVIDVRLDKQEICNAIKIALQSGFAKQCEEVQVPFRKDKASYHIKETLKSISLEALCRKEFRDLLINEVESV